MNISDHTVVYDRQANNGRTGLLQSYLLSSSGNNRKPQVRRRKEKPGLPCIAGLFLNDSGLGTFLFIKAIPEFFLFHKDLCELFY